MIRILLSATAAWLIPLLAAAQVPEINSTQGAAARAEAGASTTPVRGVPADLFDDFESYTPGQSLVDQSDWFNLVDFSDTVVADGIDGQSAAHVSDGSSNSGQVLGRQSDTAEFGTLSLDVEVSSGESILTIFPSTEVNILATGIQFFPGNPIVVFQDSNPDDGFLEAVGTGATWQDNTPMRVDFEIDASGRLMIRIDGRLVFAGEDTAKVNNGGVSSPVNFFGIRSSNSTAGDQIMIDNLSDTRTIAADGAGEADLYHVIGFGELELFDTITDIAAIYLEQTFSVSAITFNTSATETADDVEVTVQIPPELKLFSDNCNGSVAAGEYTSQAFSLAPGDNRVCILDLQLVAQPDGGFAELISDAASETTVDPFVDNNQAVFFVVEDPGIVFRDGFEIP